MTTPLEQVAEALKAVQLEPEAHCELASVLDDKDFPVVASAAIEALRVGAKPVAWHLQNRNSEKFAYVDTELPEEMQKTFIITPLYTLDAVLGTQSEIEK